MLGLILFLLTINDISNFISEGYVLNMFAADVIIYAAADDVEKLQPTLETYMNSVTRRYSNFCLAISGKNPVSW